MTPLLRHDLTRQLRRPRTYLLLSASAVLAGSALAVDWPPGGVLPFDTRAGPVLFARLAQAQILLVMITAPALAGLAIVAERERETLPLLAASLISPAQITTSRILLVVGQLGLMTVATLPFLAATLFLGGARPIWLLAQAESLAGLAFFLAAAGVLVSARSRHSATAVPLSYAAGWTGAYALQACGLFKEEYVFLGVDQALLPRLGGSAAGALEPAQPAAFVALALGALWLGGRATWREVRRRREWHCAAAAAITAGFILSAWPASGAGRVGLHCAVLSGLALSRLAAAALARPLTPLPAWRHRWRARRARLHRCATQPPAGAANRRQKRATGRHANPVLGTESRIRLLGAPRVLLAVGCLAMALSQLFLLVLTLRLEWFVDAGRWVFAVVSVSLAAAWVGCSTLAAAAIPLERERQTLPLLLASLISPGRIIMGKWLGALWRGQVCLVSILPLLAMATLTETLALSAAIRLLVVFAGTVLLATGFGLGLSAFAGRTAQAVSRVLVFTCAAAALGAVAPATPPDWLMGRLGREAAGSVLPWRLAAEAVSEPGPLSGLWSRSAPVPAGLVTPAELQFIALAVAVNVVALAVTTWRLRQMPRGAAR